MADRWHVNWLREGVQRWNKRRKKVIFEPDLSGLNFSDLLPPDYRDNPKTSRYFEKIDLSHANLSEADLSNLNFSRAKFEGANLSLADLSKSNFQYANFSGSILRGILCENTHMEEAIFDGAVIENVDFQETNVKGAIFIDNEMSDGQAASMVSMEARVFSTRDNYLRYQEEHRLLSIGDMARRAGEQDGRSRKNRYDVFFGTNRQPIIERGAVVDFGPMPASELSFGICEVIVPEGHRIGSLGSRIWKRLWNKHDDRLHLANLVSLNEELFWQAIRDTTVKMKVKEKPTVFIHGYNASFKQAAIRAAQLGYDLGIGQGVALFSWPSKGKFAGYSADEAASEASKYLLADFIEQFVERGYHNSVNIIAHSMGCRCLFGALEILSNGRKKVVKSIDQIILAAADVDTAIMPRLAPYAVGNCKRMTSYISDRDKALMISGWLHSFPRVGITPPTFVFSGMDTILVNDLDLGGFSHGYVGTSRIVLNDIFNILKHNFPPSKRHSIEAVVEGSLHYWRVRN